jgi:hypothetical protein
MYGEKSSTPFIELIKMYFQNLKKMSLKRKLKNDDKIYM